MRERYRLTYNFVDTEDEAKRMVENWNAERTPYMKQKYEASYQPWTSSNGKEHKFLVWSYYKG